MIKSLSILLPSYNNECLTFVTSLQRQAEAVSDVNFKYEIIVADDGSTDFRYIKKNNRINELTNCKYIIRNHNTGRAAIRNFLVSEAQYEYVLLLDSDLNTCSEDFINRYLKLDDVDVACGGLKIGGNPEELSHNLRYKVEKNFEKKHNTQDRQEREYSNFTTANFITKREIITRIPFDKRFYRYGYEDVMWGKQLRDNYIHITHIDNPVLFDEFDDNRHYIKKVETSISTLYHFKDEIREYSALIIAYNKLKSYKLSGLFYAFFKTAKKAIRVNLIGKRPSIWLLNIYKLGIYAELDK